LWDSNHSRGGWRGYSRTALALESCRLDVTHFHAGLGDRLGAFCNLGSFASLANYQNPELDFVDIIANSGVGSSVVYGKGTDDLPPMLAVPISFLDMARASSNLDMPFILGLGEGGIDSAGNTNFKDEAAETIYFNNGDEAFDHLKRVITSGRPVQVIIDFYYTYDDFAAVSNWWGTVRTKMHRSL